MTSPLRTLVVVALVIASGALVACGEITAGPNSTTVGAACTADGQCQQQCLVNDRHFPGGMCTVACTRDADCPAGSLCIDEEGGVCVVTCAADADCAAFGRGFACDREGRLSGGEAAICRVP